MIVIFVNMFQFVLIVYFLLDWLGFWAEVHLVQGEIDFSQKGFVTRIFHILGYFLGGDLPFFPGVFSFWLGPTGEKSRAFF